MLNNTGAGTEPSVMAGPATLRASENVTQSCQHQSGTPSAYRPEEEEEGTASITRDL